MFPAELVERLLKADSLVREWRTYRGLSQEKLAEGGHCPADCGGIGLRPGRFVLKLANG